MRIPTCGQGEGAIAALYVGPGLEHQAVALKRDISRLPPFAASIETIWIVVVTITWHDYMDEIVFQFALLVVRRLHIRWQLTGPLQMRLAGRELEPADKANHAVLMVRNEEHFTHRQSGVAQAGDLRVIQFVNEHGEIAEGAERTEIGVVLRREVCGRGVAFLEQYIAGLLAPEANITILHQLIVTDGEPLVDHVAWGQ